MTDSQIIAILRDLYASEITYQISTFWDEGYTVMLGDPLNGWKSEAVELRSLDEVAAWLKDTAIRRYPHSEFRAEASGQIG